MTAPIITFFNNKSGVGNTSLVYHLAWMFADMGVRVLTLDLDPQADLTTAFIDEDRLELLMGDGEASTIFTCVQPVLDGTGSLLTPSLEYVTDSLALLAGDLTLSKYEQELSQEWPKCLDKNERSFLVTTAFWRLMRMSAGKMEANLILVDVGPNLGAINRAAMVATDYVVVPLSPDILSIKGLESLGPTLREWRKNWAQLRACAPPQVQELPGGDMQPIGYIIRQRSVRSLP